MGETVGGKQRFVFITHIADIFELKIQKYQSGFGKDTIFTTENRGWYARIGEGTNSVALHISDEPPKIVKGQKVRMIIEID